MAKKIKEKRSSKAFDKKRTNKKNKKVLAVSRRPIVCPPDRAGMKWWVRLTGYICRVAVIFVAVFGLTFFMCDALRLEQQELSVPAGFLALVCAAAVALFSLMKMSRYGAIGGAVVLTGGLATLLILSGDVVQFGIKLALTVKNVVLTRLYNLGYYGLGKYISELSYSSGFSAQTYLRIAFAFVGIVLALAFVLSCLKRVNVWPPIIISVAVIGVICTYNIARSNWGVAMIIASYTGLIVMAVYDKIFVSNKSTTAFDNETVLFADEDRPQMPEGGLTPEQARQVRRQKRKEFKQIKKQHKKEKTQITVEEELSNYFGSSVKAKKVKKQKKTKKTDEQKQQDAQIRKVIKYDRTVKDSRTAHGGFAAFGAFVLAMAMLLPSALTVKSSFTTIPLIDEKMEEVREYVTALLMGDDPILDDLGYKNDKSNFLPHSTDATPRYYTGEAIMTLEMQSNLLVYLRGWIGTDYEDGAWLPADDETFERYRELYGNYLDPSEILFDYFYSVMYPDVVEDRNFLKNVNSKANYGVTAMQIHINRLETEDSLVYLPAHYRADDDGRAARAEYHGLYEYGTDVALDDVTYVNYFDGLYTGRKFMDEIEFSSIAYVTTMKKTSWYKEVADLIAVFNAGYNDAEKAIKKYAERKLSGKSASLDDIVKEIFTEVPEELVSATLSEDGTTKTIIVRQENGTVEYIYDMTTGDMVRRIMHPDLVQAIDPETGMLMVDENGQPVMEEATMAFRDMSFELLFREVMTTAQKRELANAYYWQYVYEQFVYETYTDKADSKIIKELVNSIIDDNSHIIEKLYDEETGEAYEIDHGIDEEKFDIAFERHSDDAETYELRHKLVMAIIDYMKENMTYTLTPSGAIDASLDGVENFLTVTKEGYCVQYASSLVLMLRQVGIPARYVEGYVTGESYITQNTRKEGVAAKYKTTVRDRNEHSWVEVWYDGIGWVQYEATPVYYDDMYVSGSSSGDVSVRPWYDPEDAVTEEEELLEMLLSSIESASGLIMGIRENLKTLIGGKNIKLTLDNIELTVEQYREQYNERYAFYEANRSVQGYDSRAFVQSVEQLQTQFDADVTEGLYNQLNLVTALEEANKLALVIAIIALVIAVIIIVLIMIARNAKFAEKRRMEKIDAIITNEISDEHVRETAKWLSDTLTALLKAYGSAPAKGEFRDEYAKRLEKEYMDIFGYVYVDENTTLDTPPVVISDTDFGAMFDAVAAEEFGDGMSVEQMQQIAEFYKRLRKAAKTRINIFRRVICHYIKHII